MNMDPEGRADIGLDGVMRSFSGAGTVIDYYQLNATELIGTIDFFSELKPGKKELLQGVFEGVLGTSVTDEEQIHDADTPLISDLLKSDTSPVAARSVLERYVT